MPNIIAAVFILIVGMFAAIVVRNIVRVSASNAGIAQANLFGNIAEVVIMVFAAAIALEQLQIGVRIIDLTISIILGSFGLGFALAFGLGCKRITTLTRQESACTKSWRKSTVFTLARFRQLSRFLLPRL